MSDSLFDTRAPEPQEDIPWTLDGAIAIFLHRWAFQWRGEHAEIEADLRQLIAEATQQPCEEGNSR